MRSKELVIFVGFFFMITSFLGFVSAQTTCSDPNQIILRLSSATNAHGEIWNGAGSYTEEICYNTIFGVDGDGNRVCSGTNKVLGLSSSTNAHAEKPSLTNYATDVCYSGLICRSTTGSCSGNESLVVTLSSSTNAHLATSGYNTNICCSVEGGAPPPPPPSSCSLTNAYWNTTSGNLNVEEGTSVELNVIGTPTCNGENVSFDVWEDEPFPIPDVFANIQPIDVTFNGTTATGTWTAEWIDDGPFQGDPEYFFDATTTNSSIDSGKSSSEELHVTEFIPPPCSGIVICGDYPTESGCVSDLCEVAEVSVPTNIDCDDASITCECSWNIDCNPFWTGTNPDDDSEIGTCTYDEESSDNCDDGFLTFNWTATWSWSPENPGHNDPEGLAGQCKNGFKTNVCPAQIPLPFFGVYNFIITLMIIASIYAFLTLGKRKKKSL